MIRRISANSPSFRSVEFEPGMNVVIADRADSATHQDSRNGLGKSTLIEIIHFCLGGGLDKGSTLLHPLVASWTYSLTLVLKGHELTVGRCPKTPGLVRVRGVPENLLPPATEVDADGDAELTPTHWIDILGGLTFDLPPRSSTGGTKYRPTYRSMIGYLSRRRNAYQSPFSNNPKQLEWDKQANTGFLLGLDWHDAASWQLLRDREKEAKVFAAATKSGFARDAIGSLGALEASRMTLATRVESKRSAIRTFRVHPQYREISARANDLTQSLHTLVNRQVVVGRLLQSYEAAVEETSGAADPDLRALFREAELSIPEMIQRRFEEVQAFHREVLGNRRSFLHAEIDRLRAESSDLDERIGRTTAQRANQLEIIASHGALDELRLLQQTLEKDSNELAEIDNRIGLLKRAQRERSEIKLDRELLLQQGLARFAGTEPQRAEVITRFNANSEALYSSPGVLIIELTEGGFKFGVQIQRSHSHGVEHMKVFCYDLALADVLAIRGTGPGWLIHDSVIFDGVDERQRALALQLAAERAEEGGWQYICTLNSDMVPTTEFRAGFSLERYVRLRLGDADPSESLLGIRF